MKRPTLKKSMRETLADNRKAEAGWAAAFGKPLRADFPELAPKRERAAPVPRPGAKEAEVLSAVLAYLRLHPQVAWVRRMNVGATEASDGRYIAFGFVGCSDIIGQMRDGRFLAVECKREKGGKVSDAQAAFLATVGKHGGVAGVARSIDDAVRILGETE